MTDHIYIDGHGWCEVWDLPKVPPTKQRKGRYVPESFLHPAKMSVPLCRKIIETYTRPGELVLDPMAGIGTTLIEAAYLGRNAVGVELEDKFVRIVEQNIGLLENQQTLAGKGEAKIIQGDARRLSELLCGATVEPSAIITSPPYSEVMGKKHHSPRADKIAEEKRLPVTYTDRVDAIVTSPPYSEGIGHDPGDGASEQFKERLELQKRYTRSMVSEGNIGNLPHGQVDAVITSPPFGEAQRGGGIAQKGYEGKYGKDEHLHLRHDRRFSDDERNISNLPYEVDAVITSPPYSESMSKRRKGYTTHPKLARTRHMGEDSSDDNIGNLRKETYLEAMFRVYSECFKVLRPGGRMILVIKDFVRNKKVVRLDLDTKKLCEAVGFRWVETKLFRLPGKSFWRVLYERRHPEVDTSLLRYEFVMVFEKPVGGDGYG